jgi:hypothetical protein
MIGTAIERAMGTMAQQNDERQRQNDESQAERQKQIDEGMARPVLIHRFNWILLLKPSEYLE